MAKGYGKVLEEAGTSTNITMLHEPGQMWALETSNAKLARMLASRFGFEMQKRGLSYVFTIPADSLRFVRTAK